jgi:hypothetical protein
MMQILIVNITNHSKTSICFTICFILTEIHYFLLKFQNAIFKYSTLLLRYSVYIIWRRVTLNEIARYFKPWNNHALDNRYSHSPVKILDYLLPPFVDIRFIVFVENLIYKVYYWIVGFTMLN